MLTDKYSDNIGKRHAFSLQQHFGMGLSLKEWKDEQDEYSTSERQQHDRRQDVPRRLPLKPTPRRNQYSEDVPTLH